MSTFARKAFEMNDFKQFEQSDFTTDYVGGGTRYRMPRRTLPKVRDAGWIVMAFGLFVTLFMVAWMSGPLLSGIKAWNRDPGMALFSIAFGCAGIFGLVPGLGMLIGGLAIVTNRTRCDIDIRNGKITVKDRFLLARLKRKRKISGISSLRIITASESLSEQQQYDATDWLGEYEAALSAKTNGKDFLIAAAYPREMLVRLAEELAPKLDAEIGFEAPDLGAYAPDAPQPQPQRATKIVIEEDYDTASMLPTQPANSKATVDRRPYGITIEIPPAGIWQGSKGLMFFAIIWNLFLSIFLVVGTLAATGVIEMEGDSSGPLVLLLFMIPFVAVGVGITLGAINMGRRRATIATADDLLMVVRHTIFGKTTKEWSAADLDNIRCGNSGMEVNDVPVKELQIISTKDKKFGFLSQLDEGELIWIAAELNQALGVTASNAKGLLEKSVVDRDPTGFPTPSADSRIKVERTVDGVQLIVPPRGIFRYIGLILFGLVFAVVGAGIAIGAGIPALQNGFNGIDIPELLFGLIFLLGFGGIGLGTTLAGLVAGRRRFQLTVEHDELTLLRRGPFFSKTFRWHRDNLDSVDVTSSGTEVNNKKLYHVFIRSRKSESVGIMTGHEKSDLVLVAESINESLGLGP